MENIHNMWSDKASYDHIHFETDYTFISPSSPLPNTGKKIDENDNRDHLWLVKSGAKAQTPPRLLKWFLSRQL